MREFSKFHLLFVFIFTSNLILYNVVRVEGFYGYRIAYQAVRTGINPFWFRLNRLRPLGRPVGPRRRRRVGNNNNNNNNNNNVGGGGDNTGDGGSKEVEIDPQDTYPPGYQESILTIAAFCMPESKVSSDDQNALYECMNDEETGERAPFMDEFEKCVSDDASSCDSASMETFQECVNGMEGVDVPESNIQCMEEGLSQKTLTVIKSEYPVLFGASNSPMPSNSPTKKSTNKTQLKSKLHSPPAKKKQGQGQGKAKPKSKANKPKNG